MKTRFIRRAALFLLAACCLGPIALPAAQDIPRFTGIQPLSNREIALTLSVSNGLAHRIDASTNLPFWESLVTLPGTNTTLQHTDTATPYLPQRFYRAEQLSGTNFLTGDHLSTTNGDLVIHPLFHASFVMSWNGKIIYNDPDDDSTYQATYTGLPKADLILISHDHGDHFSGTKIDALRGSNAVLVVPLYVYNNLLSVAQRAIAVVLTNGGTTNVMGVGIEAFPAYNSFHPRGQGNGYVATFGGRRLYMSGDTGDVPEIRSIPNLDVAFLCMNQSFTMNWLAATNVIRSSRPRVVYPYHYRESNGSQTNAALFKQNLGRDLGIEVRLRKWY